jgi:ribonuclease HI
VISSGYECLENVSEAIHAEMVACLQALQRAAAMGIQRVIVETDAAMIVRAAFSTEYDRCSAGGLLWELKDLWNAIMDYIPNCIRVLVANDLTSFYE